MIPQLITDETGKPIKVTHTLCEDGVRRNARCFGTAMNFYRIPAQIYVQRQTITGFVTDDGEGDFLFIANSDCKNAALLRKD